MTQFELTDEQIKKLEPTIKKAFAEQRKNGTPWILYAQIVFPDQRHTDIDRPVVRAGLVQDGQKAVILRDYIETIIQSVIKNDQ